jgi:hypothetical protein
MPGIALAPPASPSFRRSRDCDLLSSKRKAFDPGYLFFPNQIKRAPWAAVIYLQEAKATVVSSCTAYVSARITPVACQVNACVHVVGSGFAEVTRESGFCRSSMMN